MKIETGDMFENASRADLILVTTCCVIKTNSTRGTRELVMGRGAARDAVKADKELPAVLAREISKSGVFFNRMYGIAIPERRSPWIGAFQTKMHYREQSNLLIIQYSVYCLCKWIEDRKNNNMAIFLNYPGIGLGKLSKSDVEPIISVLPNNVTVWKREKHE